MRTSQFLLSTLKETPSDAVVISHQLMLRAGMIRKLASGLYTWLPMGLRVLRKVENVVREETNAAGALEVLMPAIQPAELWQESGRWVQYGPELLRIKDRHDREFCVGPTHEEVITDLARNELNSYKQLPINFYQIQTKFRDEIRPRFGLMRGREFIMKDAYSFHADQASLQETYDRMHQAYCNVFTRLGLNFRPVQADTGSIGGTGSHEFHVLADSGEDDIAFSDTSDYAANIEKAEALPREKVRPAPTEELRLVDTPGHARHHHCIWDEASRGWFTGDTFGLSYREFDTAAGAWILPTSTPVQFEPEALRASVGRLLERAPRCVYLTHYGRVGDVAAAAAVDGGHVLQVVEVGAPVVGHAAGVVEVGLVQLLHVGRVAAEQVGVEPVLLHHRSLTFRPGFRGC